MAERQRAFSFCATCGRPVQPGGEATLLSHRTTLGTESAAQLDILLRLEFIGSADQERTTRLLQRIVSMLVKISKPRDA